MHTIRRIALAATLVAPALSRKHHELSRRQDGPVDSSTISDCTYYTSAAEGDTCASIAGYWGISEQDFITYNPVVGQDCSNLVVGNSYCVEENYGMGPAPKTSATTSTFSSMAATSTSANVPSPTQNGLTADCSRFYNVKDGDYCASIVNMYRTFTLDDFYGWNPAVHDDCSGLIAGYYVCVGVPGTPTSAPALAPTPTGPQPTQTGIEDDCTTYYQVQSGDYCQGIVDMYGTFSLSDFYSWNPAVGTDCSHLQVGYYVCVGVPGTPATRVGTSTTPTPTGPSPTQSGIATDCTKYYQAVSGDSCAVIADKFGTFSVTDFEEWNPAVQSDCSKLFLGYYYCIAVPGTPTHRSSSSAVSPTPTLSGPQPQQPGIVQNCNDYYLVNSGDYCYAIEQSQGISADDFFKWNTGLNKDCSNLFSGYYVCVGVS